LRGTTPFLIQEKSDQQSFCCVKFSVAVQINNTLGFIAGFIAGFTAGLPLFPGLPAGACRGNIRARQSLAHAISAADLRLVFGKPPIAHLAIAKLAFDGPENRLHLGAHGAVFLVALSFARPTKTRCKGRQKYNTEIRACSELP